LLVAFQGEHGAFSDDVASQFFPGAETRGFDTFDALAAAVAEGPADFAVMPVENSISGSIPRVYDLLWTYSDLVVVDEIVYRVVQNLIALPQTKIEDIREVRSHPVALEQCRGFLSKHPSWHAVIVADTAGAVRAMMQAGDPSSAAIGSAIAARRYGAAVLAAGIQDINDNFTRFLLVTRDGSARRNLGRACIALTLANRPGSLHDALRAFADANLNLRSLVSRPTNDDPFTYRFYCEVEHVTAETLGAALARIDGTSRILGLY
jgi:prephenate dehydratase